MVAQHQIQSTQGPVLQTAGAGVNSTYWMKDKTGNVIKQEMTKDDIGTPPSNGYFRLRLIGISDVFEMNGQYGRSQNVRLLLVVNQPGSHAHKQKFSEMVSVAKWGDQSESFYPTIGSRSKIGQVLGSIQREDIDLNTSITLTNFIGGEFMANVKQTVKQTDNGTQVYANTVHDTIVMVDDGAPQSAPEPVANAANPFTSGIDDL